MVNLALILGTGYNGEDVLHKTPWIRNLDKKHKIYTMSRVKPGIHLRESVRELIGSQNLENILTSFNEINEISNDFCIIYDSDNLNKEFSSSELEKLQLWLGISFKYIASFDRRFYDRNKMKDNRDEDELFNFLACLTIFFKEFFEANKINVFINSLEDDIISVMGYFVAKKLRIKIIGFVSSRFPKTGVMFSNDFSKIIEFDPNFNDVEYEEILRMYDMNTIISRETLNHNKNDLSMISLLKKYNGINYIFKSKKNRNYIISKYNYEKFIIEPPGLGVETKRYIKKFFRRYLVNYIIEKPNYNEKYFLFPLHYMEDAQITFKEPLIDQIKLIRDISRSLPLHSYLYVKPHPHYLGTDISFFDLYKLSKFKNIKIINPTIPSIELMTHSRGVITVNSTTGFEALIMGIPLITLGHDFYSDKQVCLVIRDINNLSKSIVDILNNHLFEKNDLENFVKKIYKNTIWIEDNYYKDQKFAHFSLTDDDGKKVAEALNIILSQI